MELYLHSLYIFMAWYLIMERHNFILPSIKPTELDSLKYSAQVKLSMLLLSGPNGVSLPTASAFSGGPSAGDSASFMHSPWEHFGRLG
jgi:hypothetical protein